MDLYAYCLADKVEGSAIESVVGIAGKAPRLISYDGITAVTSEFEGNRVEVNRENVYSHERVVGFVNVRTSPLPFRFGTLVSAAKLSQYVESNRRSLLDLLDRVRGSVEMSVKIICQPEPDGGAIERVPIEVSDPAIGTGARFLVEKQREMAQAESVKGRAEEIAAWLAESLAGTVGESVVRLRPSVGLAVAAAHLVERTRLGTYRDRLSTARRERPNLHFLTSGPWPPYSFVGLPVEGFEC
jgi:hypothetical protein